MLNYIVWTNSMLHTMLLFFFTFFWLKWLKVIIHWVNNIAFPQEMLKLRCPFYNLKKLQSPSLKDEMCYTLVHFNEQAL